MAKQRSIPVRCLVFLSMMMPFAGFQSRAGAEELLAGNDQQRIQGTWLCIATLNDGKQVTKYVGVRAVMQGNRLTWFFPQPDGKMQTTEALFQIDVSQNPKHFDWYLKQKSDQIHKRLYILEDDVLIWSTNLGTEDRPESFSTGRWQFVMKRLVQRN